MAQKGHTLLADKWQGENASYRFRCAHGHEISRTGAHALRFLIDCLACKAEAKLARLQQIARQAGGECLSTSYSNNSAMYRFCCRLGHEFETHGLSVMAGTWCRRCADFRRGEASRDPEGPARIQEAAASVVANGCRSPIPGYRTPTASAAPRATSGRLAALMWCAANGADCVHTRRAARPLCARTGWTSCVASRKSAVGNASRMTMKAPKSATASGAHRGTSGKTTGAIVTQGAWCPDCARDKHKLGIEAMREMAAQRGGLCISDTYVNSVTKLEWECARGTAGIPPLRRFVLVAGACNATTCR
ncbi:hypothetical protein [Ralstonia pseudosolanacearum]|uniref:hypothetical protein n=1 Tax=Ralstonia pseudosolanacearum TaxID=1310165 RepID=UPI001E2E1C78|nr:hypothetical protein [Ralstonia pseudosolanacearum]